MLRVEQSAQLRRKEEIQEVFAQQQQEVQEGSELVGSVALTLAFGKVDSRKDQKRVGACR